MAFFKKRTKADVVSKENFSRGTNKNGKPRKSGTIVHYNDNTSSILLTPAGKGEKFASELKQGIKINNDGKVKQDEFGMPIALTDKQRAYRGGYLDAQKDSARLYNAKKNNIQNKSK